MILWLIFVTLSLVLWTVLVRYRRRRLYKLASLLPAPKEEVPVIGVAHTLTGNAEEIMTTLQTISYEAMETKGLTRGWLAHIFYVVLVNPVDLEYVLKTCLEKDDLHRFIRKLTGFGGIFAPVSIWRRRRKIMVPAFTPKILDSFIGVFAEQSARLAEKLDTVADGQEFSVWPFLNTYTLDSVCETAMGVKMNAQGNPNNSFLLALNRILNIMCLRIFHLWLQPDWLFKLFPQYTEHEMCLKTMFDFVHDVIRKKKNAYIASKNQSEQEMKFDPLNYKQKSFLEILIKLSGGEKGFNDVELCEEVLTLTVAGTDTSAVAVGYTLKLLAKYPKIQEKLFEEIYEIFGDSDRPLEKEDLNNLKYLERVLKESLRLFPPVPFIIRKVEHEVTLPNSGYTLPAGSGVVVSIWGIHRDPNYWGPDAEHFDPDRFLPERFNLQHSTSFMPFSSGPRNCVGYQYAFMSLKASLSAILRRYRVIGTPEDGPIPRIRVKLDIMMKAVDDYTIALERRKPRSVQ